MTEYLNGLVQMEANVLAHDIQQLLTARLANIEAQREAAVLRAMEPRTVKTWVFFKKTVSRTREEALAHVKSSNLDFWEISEWERIELRGHRTAALFKEIQAAAELVPGTTMLISTRVAEKLANALKTRRIYS